MTSRKAQRFEPLIELGGTDPSAGEYIAGRPAAWQREERRKVELLAACFAGTRAPAPLWPRMPGRGLRVNLDVIPWSKLTPDQLREIARRQYAIAAQGPVRPEILQGEAPGEPLKRRSAKRPRGAGRAKRHVYALRNILRCAFDAGRMTREQYLERYEALRGY